MSKQATVDTTGARHSAPIEHDLVLDVATASVGAPRVLIVVLCYNGCELTLACLRSLQGMTYPVFQVLVVDNASADNTVAAVGAAFPATNIVETGANLGYAAGNNVGLRYALEHGYDYALLLNNDTEVDPGLLDALVRAAEADPRIGAVGPKILYHDRPDVIWSAGGTIDWRRGCSSMRGMDEPDRGQYDQTVAVDFVTGCALLVRCRTIEVAGLLDERFGMYFEETEWCVRMGSAGWQVVYEPGGRLCHKIQPARQDWSPLVTYYMCRNRLLFLHLTRAPAVAWFHAAILQDLRTWSAWRLRRRWHGRGRQRVAMRRAWRDFLCGRFGMRPAA